MSYSLGTKEQRWDTRPLSTWREKEHPGGFSREESDIPHGHPSAVGTLHLYPGKKSILFTAMILALLLAITIKLSGNIKYAEKKSQYEI